MFQIILENDYLKCAKLEEQKQKYLQEIYAVSKNDKGEIGNWINQFIPTNLLYHFCSDFDFQKYLFYQVSDKGYSLGRENKYSREYFKVI